MSPSSASVFKCELRSAVEILHMVVLPFVKVRCNSQSFCLRLKDGVERGAESCVTTKDTSG